MSNIRNLFLSVFIMLLLGSCGGSEEDAPSGQPNVQTQPSTTSFRIDNVNWYAGANVSSGTLLAYRGQEVLQIQLPTYDPGTYNISSSPIPSVRLSQYAGQDYDSYACSPFQGRITITSNTGGKLSGTFYARVCSGGQIKDITNGVFTQIPIQ